MVRCLLDTHALFWWVFFPELLPSKVRDLLSEPGTDVFVSALSAYEMSQKHQGGRWPEVGPLVGAFEEVVDAEGFTLLPLLADHAIQAGCYVADQRDPFDRMLAA